ncbi:MAG: thioredoxin [Deltaproteobacteria bacterium]|nr:MAG: thioredoxin [Deltaproteobacteria bacterium]
MKALSEANFDRALADAPGLVLVDFWADWCGPCKTLGPILEGLEPEYEGRVLFAKVNADENRRLMGAFGVRSLPTVLLLAPRQPGPGADVVGYTVGVKPPDGIRRMIDRILEPKPSLMQRVKGMFGGPKEKSE